MQLEEAVQFQIRCCADSYSLLEVKMVGMQSALDIASEHLPKTDLDIVISNIKTVMEEMAEVKFFYEVLKVRDNAKYQLYMPGSGILTRFSINVL